MMGKERPENGKLFYYNFNVEERIPENHPLRMVKKIVNFNFINNEVKDRYGYNGNVSVPPSVLLKMMFLLFFYDVKSERALVSDLPMRLDWLWFLGYDLDDNIPDHSVLSKARKRWGKELFREFFMRIVAQCIEANLVDGKKIFVDSTLIDANASRASIVDRESADRFLDKKYAELESKLNDEVGRYASTTDPDSGCVKYGNDKSRSRYKEHRGIDSKCGVITGSIVTSGVVDDGSMFEPLVDMHESCTGTKVEVGVGDHKYGIRSNYLVCKDRNIKPHFNDLQSAYSHNGEWHGVISPDQFEYDSETDTLICPNGKRLKRRSYEKKKRQIKYISSIEDCEKCPLHSKCTKSRSGCRTVAIHERQEDIDEMRSEALSKRSKEDLIKRFWFMEGSFADGANMHGLKRMRWRGKWRSEIQVCLIAAIQNIRILIKYGHPKRDIISNSMKIMGNIRHFKGDLELIPHFLLEMQRILLIFCVIEKNRWCHG